MKQNDKNGLLDDIIWNISLLGLLMRDIGDYHNNG